MAQGEGLEFKPQYHKKKKKKKKRKPEKGKPTLSGSDFHLHPPCSLTFSKLHLHPRVLPWILLSGHKECRLLITDCTIAINTMINIMTHMLYH
jgi:hypothetical protein